MAVSLQSLADSRAQPGNGNNRRDAARDGPAPDLSEWRLAPKPEETAVAPKIGYLLPTREGVMAGRHETGPLLALAEKAEALGYDSLWIGDSVTARPRHDPLTLMAAVAARTNRPQIGTAVLLPALRNPFLLAQQVATVDQVAEGRIILGVGVATDNASIRAEFAACGVPFEKRAGRMMEGLRLCKALWSGQTVDWDGRWQATGVKLGPLPYREGGPPIWGGGAAPAPIARAGQHYDGWFPSTGSADEYRQNLALVRAAAKGAGRADDAITGAIYLTLVVDDDAERADAQIGQFLSDYYGAQAAQTMRKRQSCFAGSAEACAAYLKSFVAAGASHLVLRFAGDHNRHLDQLADIRRGLDW
jgi:alkanesulfonate monooxygenase SsuD/methylene tetrahydromethanopterin reductase-like flavin-dependent oxidoreductase (luciferase family)